MKIQPSQISFTVNRLREGGIASALGWRLLSNTDTSLRISWKLHSVRLFSRSTTVYSARYAIEESEVMAEKAPSFVKKGYSLEPRASSGRFLLHPQESFGVIPKSQLRHIGALVWVYVCKQGCKVHRVFPEFSIHMRYPSRQVTHSSMIVTIHQRIA